ncbi:MAG: hypothetical protein IT558_05030 [Alphaproteobacteria bacterium]|nr:hypothetical protein [Alphaproteobacteria bacterium]
MRIVGDLYMNLKATLPVIAVLFSGCTMSSREQKPREPVHFVEIAHNGRISYLPDVINRSGLFPECTNGTSDEENPSPAAVTYCKDSFAAGSQQESAKQVSKATYDAALEKIKRLQRQLDAETLERVTKIQGSIDTKLPCAAQTQELAARMAQEEQQNPNKLTAEIESGRESALKQKTKTDKAAWNEYYETMKRLQIAFLGLKPGKNELKVTRTFEAKYTID